MKERMSVDPENKGYIDSKIKFDNLKARLVKPGILITTGANKSHMQGHVELKTTQRYTYITNHALIHVRSPLSKVVLKRKKHLADKSRAP